MLAAHFGNRAWTWFTRTPVARSPLALSSNPTARFASLAEQPLPAVASAITAWEDHPFDGTGAGTWPLWWNQHGTDGEYTRNTHNLWLENLAELGAPGLVLIVAVALAALAVALAVRRRVRRSVSVGAAAALAAALIRVPVGRERRLDVAIDGGHRARARARRRFPYGCRGAAGRAGWLRAALAVAAAAIGAVQIPGLVSTVELRHSQAAAAVGQHRPGAVVGTDAVGAEPWSASAWEQRALVEETAGSCRRPPTTSARRSSMSRPTTPTGS